MTKTSDRDMRLQLSPHGASLEGTPLEALGGLAATMVVNDETLHVDMALPERSLTEIRWAADKVLRGLRESFGKRPMTIGRAKGVTDDTLLAVALDQHNATGGQVTLDEEPTLDAAFVRLGAAEDQYRSWVNEDPATRTSIAIAHDVEAFAKERDDVTSTVLTEADLVLEGMRLLLAVGGGSVASPPRLVCASYEPKGGKGGAPLMLLGKGITFDSGGINVKPYESFVSMMKNDMAGSALAWALFTTLVEGGYDRPLVVVLPTCENSVDANAMRPGALVKSYEGTTVRIDHTDAEGRLVLADGLAWATKQYQPEKVICFATLTTAALIAYGPYATPVHFADDALEKALRTASMETGEDLHFFPERIWHTEANRDQEADLKNTARLPGHAARSAGSRNAGHFLKHFATTPFVHLDIFASTWNWAGDAPGSGYGATGSPLRTMIKALEA